MWVEAVNQEKKKISKLFLYKLEYGMCSQNQVHNMN